MKEIMKKIKEKKNIFFEIAIIALIILFGFSIAPKTLQNETY